MGLYWHKNPNWLAWFYPSDLLWRGSPYSVWRAQGHDDSMEADAQPTKLVYLTFDDGPVPEATPMVMAMLREFNAKATFFQVGDNVRKYPELAKNLQSEGHSIGNHTYNHIKGSRVATAVYKNQVQQCADIQHSVLGDGLRAEGKERRLNEAGIRPLFRPPYGRINYAQCKALSDFQIVMWDVLSGDFDPDLSADKCLANTIAATQPGSIVVFHDSVKAMPRLQIVLPKYLQWLSDNGYLAVAL